MDLVERLYLSNSKYTVAFATTALDSDGTDSVVLLEVTSML